MLYLLEKALPLIKCPSQVTATFEVFGYQCNVQPTFTCVFVMLYMVENRASCLEYKMEYNVLNNFAF